MDGVKLLFRPDKAMRCKLVALSGPILFAVDSCVTLNLSLDLLVLMSTLHGFADDSTQSVVASLLFLLVKI